jgi:anti-sigma factor RsiW
MSRAVLDRASTGALTARCRAIRDRLSEHLDGTLGEREGERLEAHLAACPACRAFANTLEATIRAIRELPREQLSPAARARLQQLVPAPDVNQREVADGGHLGPRGPQR